MRFPETLGGFLLLWCVFALPSLLALYLFAPRMVFAGGLVIGAALLGGAFQTYAAGKGKQ